ncbi:MAG: XRE family transcriptional regulator [Chloroflexi bacterium]|nr:XRE family transcriptional regulator [Chloroflexota bacterium]
MTIKIHLSRLLGERRMTVAELSRHTGISKNALGQLYHETSQGIRFDTLDKICTVLNCSVAEILERSSRLL